MIGFFVKKIFGTKNEREIKKLKPFVDKINQLEKEFDSLSNKEIREKSLQLIKQVRSDEKLRDAITQGEMVDILPEAFALVKEAAKRTLGLRPFDVQLIGAMALHKGTVAEMKTGEGKTLVASISIYLNALTGKGVHLVTVNDYLAKRDAVWMGSIYKFLGLDVGVINTNHQSFIVKWVDEDKFNEAIEKDMRVWPKGYEGELLPSELFNIEARKNFFTEAVEAERRQAYEADITYGTNNEFGFDYLRDNMVFSKDQIVQVKGHHYAIVDEVDSILIDEARTPLIISGPSGEDVSIYYSADAFVKTLVKDEDFQIDEKNKTAVLTEKGVEKAEKYFNLENLYDPRNIDILHAITQSLRANTLFHRDVDYVVKDGEVIIVDEFTGRLMPGRRWSDGLHQAIEAKEGVKIEAENQTLASITFQNYFRMYDKLAGMTGTAETEAEEFKEIYGLDVLVIPTNKPVIRKDYPDLVYKTKREKYEAAIKEIEELHNQGRPILVGTASIETSEHLSALLKKKGIKHHVLNAKHHEKEAEIIAQAGRIGAVTIATNMAGRGTDILLGGNPEFLAKEILKKKGLTPEKATEEQYKEALKEAQKITAEEKKKVIELGGLAVIGTERHESRRIDNQLRGRAGRQGDPGSSRFYLSLEDDLLRLFGGDKLKALMDRLKIPDGEPIESTMVSKAIENAQKRVEGQNFQIRKRLLEFDDVMNKQRQVIYSLRRDILEGANLQEELKQWLYDVSLFYIDKYAPAEEYQEKWELKELEKSFKEWLGVDVKIPEDREWDRKELEDHIFEQLEQFYKNKEEQAGSQVMREFERYITLQVLDSLWKEHLHMLDRLRESVYLRGYAQRDPLVEYKKEAFNLFEDMLFRTKQNTLEYLFKVQIASEEEIQEEQRRKEEETERLLKEATATTDEQEARKKKKKKKVIKYKNRMERRKRKK
ncbi:MAG TPA: preprotein translocase subunit SecA [Persephonella sp.]|uniref:Protein translocase subunit SecA n=1 Tax=Persephonella marina (strain DSM 14350 / EX-H1) TaxID=123214 RepID=C0QRJ2_PERMH|nr:MULTISPECIES: preprotein translocase subunit SecA [Persephonella]ACO03438.1 preprotein translocase, SecA subunit [Persephonella marina EX-H1]HCB69033.1 preprotein translocase subunit SecA [Persephonella sp.]